MRNQYIVRLDDIHPRMRHDRFWAFCELMDKYNVRPIIGVIPNNGDTSLNYADEDPAFFARMRQLQQRGYAVALHGYDHCYVTKKSGLMGINSYSEFAGVGYRSQVERIRAGVDALKNEGIAVDCFMAPAHSFDGNTLRALRECAINVVTDGFYMFPRHSDNLIFVPQQFWQFRKISLPGVYTFCFHLDMLSDNEFENLLNNAEAFFEQYAQRFVRLDSTLFEKYRGLGYATLNVIFKIFFTVLYRAKRLRR